MRKFLYLLATTLIFTLLIFLITLQNPSFQGRLGARIAENITTIRDVRGDSQLPLMSTSYSRRQTRLSEHINDIKQYIPEDCVQARQEWSKKEKNIDLTQELLKKKWNTARKYCANMPNYILANL